MGIFSTTFNEDNGAFRACGIGKLLIPQRQKMSDPAKVALSAI